MATNTAEYQVIVNWTDPQERNIGSFDHNTDVWIADTGARVDLSTDYVRSSPYSLKISADVAGTEIVFDDLGSLFDTFVFGSDTSPAVGLAAHKIVTGLTIGQAYTVFGWAYVPSGGRHVQLTVPGALFSTTTTVKDDWLYLETSFVASTVSTTVQLMMVSTTGTISAPVYIDDMRIKFMGEDITCLVYSQGDTIEVNEGRDTPRALSAVATSETSFDFDNLNRLYSPNNPLSVVGDNAANAATNSPLQIRAIFEGRFYILYNGFIDDYVIKRLVPGKSFISLTGIDVLGKLAATHISTGLFQNIRTGEAIGKVLDEINWPEEKRKLDFGATVIDWWWEDDTNALDAIQKLLSAEGLPSIIYTDDVGDFVFKDRHHRYVSTFSTQVVAHFAECDSDPAL